MNNVCNTSFEFYDRGRAVGRFETANEAMIMKKSKNVTSHLKLQLKVEILCKIMPVVVHDTLCFRKLDMLT